MELKPLKTLLIEDSEDDALLLVHELKRGGFLPSFTQVDTFVQLEEAIKEEWDIVFCDYSMPTMNGLEALSTVRKNNQDVPFIFVSGTIGEELAAEAMRTGAQDYIMKGRLQRLTPAVQRELDEAKIKRSGRAAEDRLAQLAHYDELTGLPNRIQLLEVLSGFIEIAKGNDQLFSVTFINLDRFKTINNSLGYEAGNLLLQQTARRLQSCLPANRMIAHLTGDEFVIISPVITQQKEISTAIEEVQRILSRPFYIQGCMLYLGASIGSALYPADGDSATDLLVNADRAASRAKHDGGKHHCFYLPEMHVKLDERLRLDHAMRQGLKKNEFVLHYQPQVELNSGQITGLEVLIRWDRGFEHLVGPNEFIPLAEETGFILPLGEWILEQACFQMRNWIDHGLAPLRIAVNLSARQLLQPELNKTIISILEKHDLSFEWLELEVTESAIIQDLQKALLSLNQLRNLGFKVALDDFGTGYSSLSHLKNFKIDSLKIDRTFIMDIPRDEEEMAITAAVIAMGARLGIKLVAEGVETLEQYHFLKQEGCDLVQGYFLGKPMPAEQVLPILRRGKIRSL